MFQKKHYFYIMPLWASSMPIRGTHTLHIRPLSAKADNGTDVGTLAIIKGNKMNRTYRKGAIGALTDEYEKALNELKEMLLQIPDAEFQKVYNEKTCSFLTANYFLSNINYYTRYKLFYLWYNLKIIH